VKQVARETRSLKDNHGLRGFHDTVAPLPAAANDIAVVFFDAVKSVESAAAFCFSRKGPLFVESGLGSVIFSQAS
jgi:hypothetical protein